MSKKSKKRIRYIVIILIILAVITAALCAILTLRSKNNDEGQHETEQESTEQQQESEPELPPEIETVPVASDDAAGELHHALEIALSDTSGDMNDVVTSLSISAELGNSDAMYFLGELYFQGIGVEADLEAAAAYLKQACDSGNRKAMSLYGKMLFMGDGTTQNYDESASCFYTLSQEDGEACYILGVMSNLGMGVPRSAQRAIKYIDQASEAGYEKAESYRGKIVDIGRTVDGTKDFTLQAKKVQELDYGAEYEALQECIDTYYNMLKASEDYSAFEEEMTALLNVDLNGVSTVTLFGNNGYLFHQNENDGTSLHDYIGDNHFSQQELEEIAANLEKEKKWVEQNGSQFVLLLIPNKETMYPEWMPSYISRADTMTREDQLVEYLRENTDINVVYVKDTLMQNKELCPLYYKTDTHTNMIGSLYIVSDLLSACYDVEITPSLDMFDIHMQDYVGDLGTTANCTSRYVDTVYFYPERSVDDAQKVKSSMMLVGDSFSEFINIETAYYMRGGVNHQMIAEYGYDYHSATQAGFASESIKSEYVVWECVERYLDRLK